MSEIQPIATKRRAGGTFADVLSGDTSGAQRLYRFDNGYGASVIRGFATYGAESGLWEMAVIRWNGDDFELTYDTPITDDVIRWLSDDEVQEKLREIRDLPAVSS